jgi:hypothetical protein
MFSSNFFIPGILLIVISFATFLLRVGCFQQHCFLNLNSGKFALELITISYFEICLIVGFILSDFMKYVPLVFEIYL